ncbi:hypothetical protein D9619_002517 [Psilocybe cf. subviscida]|uniref:Transcription activator GCR1-like domain-containing protein n=1 Tax=Psilocybe cf. subviscida TaxID=2480587 RepID=A0A8H5ETR5_9AGAR|nr:hypothetical protein D9619_002517 [Psilocybe cf. subviscida]
MKNLCNGGPKLPAQKLEQRVLSGLPPSTAPYSPCKRALDRPVPQRLPQSHPKSHQPEALSSGPLLYTMNTDSDTGEAPDEATVPASSLALSVASSPKLLDSADAQLSLLAKETHAERLRQQDTDAMEKGTHAAYSRHLREYEDWWDKDQARRVQSGQQSVALLSHPIAVTKVALFLQYETTRTKVGSDGKPIPGTRLGPSSVKQCISALEYERSRLENRDDYLACPESQKPLRKDTRIKSFERRAEATEPERLIQMQVNKANGLVSDTYTEEELISASTYLLKTTPEGNTSTPLKISQSLRDRAMLLLSTSMAFRGDNTRNILLSDIYLRDIPLPAVSLTHKVKALVVYSNQGKENTTGRADEQGALRHRIPELCCIGALGFYFFALFHIEQQDVPNFEPDYSRPDAGDLGFREWYYLFLFKGCNKSENSRMSYSNHRKSVNKMKANTGIHIKKSTHGGRHYAVGAAAKFGASRDGRMALGGWNDQQGSFRPCYDRDLPVDALLGAAGFNASDQLSFFVARDVLEPPTKLLSLIFPWIEDAACALDERIQKHGNNGRDNALKLLLEVLSLFRRVIIQDAAVLFASYPSCPLFTYPPFNSQDFRQFSWLSSTVIVRAEEDARHQLESHPSHVAATFRGLLMTHSMLQEESRLANSQTQEMMQAQMQIMFEMTKATALRGTVGKKRKAAEALLEEMSFCARPTPTSSKVVVASPLMTSSVAAMSVSETPHKVPPQAPTSTDLAISSDITAPAATLNSSGVAEPQVYITTSGSIFPSDVFPLSHETTIRSEQIESIAQLDATLPYAKLIKHQFVWLPQDRAKKRYAWTPFVDALWSADPATTTVDDYWTENRFGKEGRLSIQEMDAQWGPRWRRNVQKLKTEYLRRMKVIDLILKLAAKVNWTSALALRFLSDTYPHETRSGRSLADFITEERIPSILAASNTYT